MANPNTGKVLLLGGGLAAAAYAGYLYRHKSQKRPRGNSDAAQSKVVKEAEEEAVPQSKNEEEPEGNPSEESSSADSSASASEGDDGNDVEMKNTSSSDSDQQDCPQSHYRKVHKPCYKLEDTTVQRKKKSFFKEMFCGEDAEVEEYEKDEEEGILSSVQSYLWQEDNKYDHHHFGKDRKNWFTEDHRNHGADEGEEMERGGTNDNQDGEDNRDIVNTNDLDPADTEDQYEDKHADNHDYHHFGKDRKAWFTEDHREHDEGSAGEEQGLEVKDRRTYFFNYGQANDEDKDGNERDDSDPQHSYQNFSKDRHTWFTEDHRDDHSEENNQDQEDESSKNEDENDKKENWRDWMGPQKAKDEEKKEVSHIKDTNCPCDPPKPVSLTSNRSEKPKTETIKNEKVMSSQKLQEEPDSNCPCGTESTSPKNALHEVQDENCPCEA